jgi:hypothetical protein
LATAWRALSSTLDAAASTGWAVPPELSGGGAGGDDDDRDDDTGGKGGKGDTGKGEAEDGPSMVI